jgi:uncharacterized membrane protein YfcA
MLAFLLLLLLGAAVGAYGTLIGAGGGFVLVPALLLIYPHDQPTTITAISLAVVFCNAASGTLAYARQQRVDYRTGLAFSAASVPGAVAGVFATSLFQRGPFDVLLGVLLILLAIWISVRPAAEDSPVAVVPGQTRRTLTDACGTTYTYTFSLPLGIALSTMVGFLSSLIGIGGGIIHVPVMVQLLHIPIHVATATSHFVLAQTSFVGSVVHALRGDYAHTLGRVVPLCIGVIAGAQAGALLSTRLRGMLIVRLLALALALVGIRLIVGVFV